MTFNEHGAAMIEIAVKHRQEAGPDGAAEGRDLSLAITHLEDALTRYNSSRYRNRGIWGRTDPDLIPTAPSATRSS